MHKLCGWQRSLYRLPSSSLGTPSPAPAPCILSPCASGDSDKTIHHTQDGACESEHETLSLGPTNYLKDGPIDLATVNEREEDLYCLVEIFVHFSSYHPVVSRSKVHVEERRATWSRWNDWISYLGAINPLFFFFLLKTNLCWVLFWYLELK